MKSYHKGKVVVHEEPKAFLVVHVKRKEKFLTFFMLVFQLNESEKKKKSQISSEKN